MSDDKVIPIGVADSKRRRQARSRRKAVTGLLLQESEQYADYSTRDVLVGLKGVCVALDEAQHLNVGKDYRGNLSTAAMVLATILEARDQS